MKLRLIISLLLVVAFYFVKADVYTVTNNLDSGAGSLRQAVTDANTHAGNDLINFNIPASDVASRTITLLTELPELSGPAIIDGTTQPMGNAFGISYSKIQLTTNATGLVQGFSFLADSCEVYGFFINKFSYGVSVSGAYVKIGAIQKGNVIYQCSTSAVAIQYTDHAGLQGNLIGVDTSGVLFTGSTGDGIQVINSYLVSIGGKTLLANNIISGNNYGIKLQNATFVDINSNFIGTNPAGLIAQPNQYGIYCTGINNSIEIGGDSLFEKNLISGNVFAGIYGVLSNSKILGNAIGLNNFDANLGNGTYGIYFTLGSSDNVIGGLLLRANTIADNGQEAIVFQNTTCMRNTISKNSIFCNSKLSGSGGIKLNNANNGIAAPLLSIVSSTGIAGSTIPNGTVEIFSNDSCTWCEGSDYIGTITANANGVFIANIPISGSVTATVTDMDGNTSAFSTCADSSNGACIVAGFNTSGSFCQNSNLSFIDQTVTVPSTDVSAWQWTFGDGGSSVLPSPTYSYSTTGTFSVQLIATNSDGCADTILKSIFISELPIADFLVLPVSCVNSLVYFADQSTSGSGGTITQRSWTFGDGGTSTGENPNHTYTSPGLYEVSLTVTNNFGCTDVQTTNIIIAPVVNASFTSSASGLVINFTNTSNFNGAHSSSWDFGDGNTSTLDNTINAYSTAGTYTVCLTVYDSLCEEESNACNIIDVATGINDPDLEIMVGIYPNPSTDYLTISAGDLEIQMIRLTSLAGANLLAIVNVPDIHGSYTIALPSLSMGMYLLYVETNKGVITKKVVIE